MLEGVFILRLYNQAAFGGRAVLTTLEAGIRSLSSRESTVNITAVHTIMVLIPAQHSRNQVKAVFTIGLCARPVNAHSHFFRASIVDKASAGTIPALTEWRRLQ